MVTVSVSPPVVVIPVPAAKVMVSPALMVWLEPEVPAKVKEKVPPEAEVKQVVQETAPVVEARERGREAETATVPEASGKVIILFEIVGVQVKVPVTPADCKTIWLEVAEA